MKKLGCVLVVLALACAGRVSAQQSEVIYGDDDRLDLYQVTNPKLLGFAESTVGLFSGGSVRVEGPKALLTTASYAEDYNLCPEEPFFDQRTGAFCSGSLVGPDLLMTAGHCVKSDSACKGTKFVFGFDVKKKGVNPDSVPAGEVYGCAKLLGREQVGTGADWALIKLDRPVLNHKPLALNRTGKIENGTALFVIGHPAGLPTKVAGGAKVRDASPDGYFVANLDTYGGNSGSAVFNAGTGLVEGILVRGENDYVWKGSCQVSNQCPAEGCRGEDVTKLSALTAQIPLQTPEALKAVSANKSFVDLLEANLPQ
ncbi:MAG: trypsin-like peptidase domain-containing protein [Elusimicrobia bacterium]|nr:trypsin-like peptidase domain-containing protein [Elusimicrobiota bacterium]